MTRRRSRSPKLRSGERNSRSLSPDSRERPFRKPKSSRPSLKCYREDSYLDGKSTRRFHREESPESILKRWRIERDAIGEKGVKEVWGLSPRRPEFSSDYDTSEDEEKRVESQKKENVDKHDETVKEKKTRRKKDKKRKKKKKKTEA